MELIELFVFLMQKEKTTCKEISKRFSCSMRTVYRKINKLSIAVPVVTVQGFGGGVFILPKYKKEFIKRLINN